MKQKRMAPKGILPVFFIAVAQLFPASARSQADYVLVDSTCTPQFSRFIYFSSQDTLIYITWATTTCAEQATNRHKKQKYDRLQQRVIKVYPYARAAADIMHQCEARFLEVNAERERRALLNLAEAEMKRQFEKDLRRMTVSEGLLLIKLIDRETGETSFDLIRQLKGRFNAFMWQSVARLFGHNLKTDYNPEGDDLLIENIVDRIESGDIPVSLFHVDPFMQNQLVRKD